MEKIVLPKWELLKRLRGDQVALLEAMLAAKIRPEIVYASAKTDRIITAKSLKLLTRDELSEWDNAIDEYFRLYEPNRSSTQPRLDGKAPKLDSL
jgi:hypothetical protein